MPSSYPTAVELEAAEEVFSALDSPLRLRLAVLLSERGHYVHELVDKLGKSQPLISQHLRVLKNAGLVQSERSGREVIYTMASPKALKLITAAAALHKATHPPA
ncbi:winged helix-turn-helix transcriptional regulator [Corynebacterium lizhenjunii]|uniref:Winged helix-turn-helix transcriptional regulator n=1 Tax=Corynebacterium lizhenjunii TaxID=2709394 RepID=A0A7T0KD56_9CORY|nr:metalloregulator ArsR/SmtB family transcription factor [Corynebacterium lizhenjunii]QPK78606.1 winged helix-turn-helix transcriptional regulator [Corynebacterium lizhenjunii]